jgi:hypothetical protein
MRRPTTLAVPFPFAVPTVALRAVTAACMIVAMAACGDPSEPPTGAAASPGGEGSSEPRADRTAAAVAGRPVDGHTLRLALEATREVDAGRVELVTSVTGLDPRPVDPAGSAAPEDALQVVHRAAFDRRRRQAEAETDMSRLAESLQPEAGSAADQPAGDFSAPNRMVVDGDVVYSQLGPMAGAYGLTPTDWVRIARSTFVDQRIDSDTAALLLDPLGPLDVLAQPATQVRVVGDGGDGGDVGDGGDGAGGSLGDEVRGTPVTHVAATLDGQPIDVWIDAEGRVRRLELRLEAATTGGALAGRATTTFELFDMGEPIEITPPSPTDVLGTPGTGAPPG